MSAALFHIRLAEFRFALRACRGHRTVAISVILITAIGVAGVTALSAIVKRVLFDPLPFPDPGQLVRITAVDTQSGRGVPIGFQLFDEWNRRSSAFADMVAFTSGRPTLQNDRGAEPLDVAYIGAGLDEVLGIRPILGRFFEPSEFEPGSDAVLLLTHNAWVRMFGADPAVLGRALSIDDRRHEVVGVLPPTTFEYPRSNFGMDAWLPMVPAASRPNAPVMVIGRLRSGITLEQAQADLTIVASAGAAEAFRNRGGRVISLQEDVAAGPRPALLLVLGALGVVLLIASVNVANLLLARSEERRRDLAIMSALGASRGTIARQLFCENLLLTGVGTILGLIITPWTLRAFGVLYPDPLPVDIDTSAVLDVLPVAVGLAFIIAALASLPLIWSVGAISAEGLREDSRTSTSTVSTLRVKSALIAMQLALSVLLLGSAAQLTKTFVALLQVDLGYDDDVMAFAMGMAQRDRSPERAKRFYADLFEMLRAQPDVAGVAMTNNLPTRGAATVAGLRFSGPGARNQAGFAPALNVVTASYASVLGLRILRGRYLSDSDSEGAAPVAVVNERLATEAYGSLEVVGRSFEWGSRIWHIVGVVNDIRQRGPAEPIDPALYVSWKQRPELPVFVLVRSTSNTQRLAGTIRTAVAAVDQARIAPIHTMATLADRASDLTRRDRFRAVVTSAIGILSLGLITIGIYGNIAYAVARRRREIAIRLALGASGRRVCGRFVAYAAAVAGAGAIGGLAGTLIMEQWLESAIAGFQVGEPLIAVITAGAMVAVAVVAAWVPARHASRIDPGLLLKSE